MCCFKPSPESVSATKIFAAAAGQGRQFVVYSMHVKSAEPLAMILPIPVTQPAAEDAVRFVSLKDYPEFFKDMASGFPPPPTRTRSGLGLGGAAPPNSKLEVVEVGSFEASFVPTQDDFDRLDERFRIPTKVWATVPGHAKSGFVVFQLKSGDQQVHPMAFEFPSARPRNLFFPTVHIHDGEYHDDAEFDHVLYCQRPDDSRVFRWNESAQPASMFLKIDKCAGLVDGDEHCYRRTVRGRQKNADIWV